MDLEQKLQILSSAAKYDVSCSSSGSSRKNQGGLGNGHISGICHSWADDGRCISLLKILLSNECVYDCAYCVNRLSNDFPRATFSPEEVAYLTIEFYKRNYIEGLFLSSGVYKNPNTTMELLTRTVQILREDHGFNGYIHLKAIPGADFTLIQRAGHYVDRMSVNIELPSSQGLKLLAPQKNKEAIIRPMAQIHSHMLEKKEERAKYKKTPSFVPAGQSTQMIIGATPDPDMKILKLSEGMYKKFNLKRVYYSAYMPVSSDNRLPALGSPPLLREHRLYQADWLLRFYGFKAEELLNEATPNFNPQLDPKCDWALRNLDQFPVEINRADYEMLLRVPGIGVKSARQIIIARRQSSLQYEDLKKMGVVLKRARYFITCRGKYYGEYGFKREIIRQALIDKELHEIAKGQEEQLSLFSMLSKPVPLDIVKTTLSGQL